MRENIVQALVLVGGKASRLKKDGVPIDGSKAFLHVEGKPLLQWNLYLLHKSGIRKLVIAAHEVGLLYRASLVVRSLPCTFSRIDYFQDHGLGAHGIPYELRYLLDDAFLFECGHSLNRPSHYKKLLQLKSQCAVVFTAYRPHPRNRRQPVRLTRETAQYDPEGKMAVAHPMIGTWGYAKRLALLGFNIDRIIQDFGRDGLAYVPCEMPPEFDTKDEMDLALESYKRLVADIDTI